MPGKKLKLATGNFIIKEGHCTSCNIHGIQHRRAMSIMSACQQTFGLHLERITDVQSINQHLAEMCRNAEKGSAQGLTGEFSQRRQLMQLEINYFVSRDTGWKDTHGTSHVFNKEVFACWINCLFYPLLHLRTQLVNIVNVFKLWSLNVYLLSLLCEETGSQYKASFPHSSKLFIKVKVFRQAFEIGDEIKAFLHDTSNGNFFKKVFSSGTFQ